VSRWQTLLFSLLVTVRLDAQEKTADFSTTAPGVSGSRDNSSLFTQDPQLAREDVFVAKKYKATGLLVRPFKALKLHKAGSALVNLLKAINPFSRKEVSTEGDDVIGTESTRAWTTTVGWHLGASAVPDPVTQEVGLNFLSVSRRP
jgi:hypothetical protein